MKVKKSSLIIVTDDHGGHLEGFCAVCKKHGWISELSHKKNCPLAPGSEKFVEILSWNSKDNKGS